MNPPHTSETQVISETARRELAAAEAEAKAAEPKPTRRTSRKKEADHQAPADNPTPPEKEAD